MTYQEFVEKIKTKVQKEMIPNLFDSMEFYPEGFTSNDPEVLEFIVLSNSQLGDREASPWLKSDMIVLMKGQDAVKRQRLFLRDLYKNAEKCGFDAAFEELCQLAERFVDIDSSVIDARSTAEYDKIREHLIIRPLNYSLHMQDLQGCVYKKFSDFALVLYQLMGNSSGTLLSSKIKREEMKLWNVDEEMVMKNALENSMRLFPPCVGNQKTGETMNFFEDNFSKEDIIAVMLNERSILLSTTVTSNGALAIFYPGVIEKMMKLMGGPFLAAFMNVNDVMIFDLTSKLARKYADSAKKSDMMGEMLSGRLYLCDERGITVKN